MGRPATMVEASCYVDVVEAAVTCFPRARRSIKDTKWLPSHPQDCVEARKDIGRYLTFCSGRHPHLSPAPQIAGGFHLNADGTNGEEHNRSESPKRR